MDINKLPFDEYVSIYKKVPRLCVDLVFLKKGNLLLVKRDVEPLKGIWHLPGGTILRGESIHMAARRIAKDEVNLKAKEIEFLGVLEFCESNDDFFHVVSLLHLVREYEKMEHLNGKDPEIEFFDELPQRIIKRQAKILQDLGLI